MTAREVTQVLLLHFSSETCFACVKHLCLQCLLNVCFHTDINEHITTDEPTVRDPDYINTIISVQHNVLCRAPSKTCVQKEIRDELQCKGLALSPTLINIKPVTTVLAGTDLGFNSSDTNICSIFSAFFYRMRLGRDKI